MQYSCLFILIVKHLSHRAVRNGVAVPGCPMMGRERKAPPKRGEMERYTERFL